MSALQLGGGTTGHLTPNQAKTIAALRQMAADEGEARVAELQSYKKHLAARARTGRSGSAREEDAAPDRRVGKRIKAGMPVVISREAEAFLEIQIKKLKPGRLIFPDGVRPRGRVAVIDGQRRQTDIGRIEYESRGPAPNSGHRYGFLLDKEEAGLVLTVRLPTTPFVLRSSEQQRQGDLMHRLGQMTKGRRAQSMGDAS